MKELFYLAIAISFSTISYGQSLSIVAGDTNGLSQHHNFNPPEHIERVGIGAPVECLLDINLDGYNDISIKCENSYGAMGYASNYLIVKALDSNDICYAFVDSSFCFNGYKPIYFVRLLDITDTISNDLTYSRDEIIISKELWFMKDTCYIGYETIGAKYLAIRLKSHGINGLAWVSIELYAKNSNGFSADIRETGFKSITSSIPANVISETLIYPNPSNGDININIPESDGNITATLTDLSGREILVKELVTKKTTLKLAHGTYMVTLSDKHKTFLIKKIIVR